MQDKVLLVLHEMGTLDHAVAMKSQLERAGSEVTYVIPQSRELPDWASVFFPKSQRLSEVKALRFLGDMTAVWLPTPYEDLRPVEWRNLWEKGFVVYSGYGIPLSNWERGLYRLPFFDNCDVILATGPMDRDEHFRVGGRKRKVLLAGDPLMYELSLNDKPETSKRGAGSILWAPHWTKKWVDGSPGFANWEWVVPNLYRFFRAHPDLRLVVRPHPFQKFRDGTFFSRLMVRNLFLLPNVSLSSSSLLADVIDNDVLISDGVSILAYFGSTGKPVILTENGNNPSPFNVIGRELTAGMIKVTRPRDFQKALNGLTSGSEIWAEREREKLSHLVRKYFIVRSVSPGQALLNNF